MTDEELGGLSELGRAAVWYCENGFAVFPLFPHSKKPATEHGLHDWFDDPKSAHELWSQCPDYNIGIVCGTPSHGLLVLDFDVSDDKNGIDTLKAWESVHGALPLTATAITGSGGRHYLYRTNRTNIRPSTNATLGVDVRCDGSYIVAPPSIHPSGGEYEWWEHPEDTPIATANGAVYDFLDHVQRNGGTDDDSPQRERFALPDHIKHGERNDVLYRYGCSLRGQGYPDDAIEAMLDKANRERCSAPVTDGELRSIIKQVCKRGPGHDGEGTFVSDGADLGAPGNAYRIGEGDTDPLPPFRTKGNRIQHNKLARIILTRNHARHIDGSLAVWLDNRWQWGREAVDAAAIRYADDISVSTRNEVYGYLRATAPHVTTDGDFDRCWYVQFANGTYDVMAGQFVEPNHQMLVTATLPVELDLEAPYGDADRFLESLAGGDGPTERVLKEIVGACMCCRRVMSQAPMLIGRAPDGGTAANGKSTYINVLRALLGPGNVSSLDIATLGQRFQAGRLVGRLANLGDDIPDGFLRGDELSLFKKLVTGDEIYTDVKNGQGFEFRPNATMVFSMNMMPRLADSTEGVFRRLAFVPFRAHFAPGDAGYNAHMAEDMAQPENLRRLALLGLMELPDLIMRGELTKIPDMEEEVESVRMDNSIVRRWVFDENVTALDVDHEPTQEVYDRFRRWCDNAGERYVLSKTGFTRELVTTLGNVSTGVRMPRNGMKKVRVYLMHLQTATDGVENTQ